ncbi:MAG: hypothetical protein AB1429_12045 [Pseudomonadota bacterium]|jgi:hypothetical protein
MSALRLASAWAGLLFGMSLLASFAMAAPAPTEAHKPTPIAYMVVCEDPALGDKISGRIGALIKAEPGYVVRDKFPLEKLILFVSRDKDDRVNPNGYSIAIAHVSNVKAAFLGQALLVEKPTGDERVRQTLTSMLLDQGMLEHINVAHMDQTTDGGIDDLTRGVVRVFLDKTPPNLGR